MDSTERDFSAVVAVIEADHAVILGMIERIKAEVVGPQPDRSVIAGTLDEMVVATRAHFAREDALMTDTSLEEFALHRQDHSHLLKILTDFARAFRSGTLAASAELAADLDAWLNFHIQRFDSRLRAFLGE